MSDEKKKSQTGALALWGVLGALAVAIAAMAILPKPREPETVAKETSVAVRTIVLGDIVAADILHLSGRIAPVDDLVVSAEKGGRIVELAVDRGDTVETGQLLFRLDDRLWRTALERAEIELRDAQRDHERWERLRAAGSVSDSEYDATRRRLDQARVGMEEVRVHLSQCESRAPFDGVVEDRMAEAGEFAAEGRSVLRLVSRDRLKIVASIPEREIRAVSVDRPMEFAVTTLADRTFTGRVTFVSAAANPAVHAFPIEVAVPPGADGLRAGMVVDLRLDRGAWTGGVAVPLVAIVPRKGEHLAYVAHDGRAAVRVVRIDRIAGTYALVTEGLGAGDELIVEGQRTLQDGMRVTVTAE